ncbi:MAG: BON domain-containing protein [Deltaproteobacteria bacterium]|jgi:osmotically-inducible protein OsmY
MKRSQPMTDPARRNARRTDFVLVGSPPATDRVRAALEVDGAPSLATAHTASGAMPMLHPGLTAIVVAGFGVRGSLRDETLRLATYGRTHRVPVVVLVGDGYATQDARALFSAGACAVFAWPTEGPLLAATIRAYASTMRRAGYPSAADDALARSLEARLDAIVDELTPHVSVTDFVATLTGVLASYAERREVERHLSLVPGLERWELDGILLDVDVTTDAALARRARARLAHTPGVALDTLGVSARDGRLIVAGTVRDEPERQRIMDSIVGVRGVRDIENLMTVSSAQSEEDRGRAERAKAIVDAHLVDHEGIRVSVFGPIAVLTGRSKERVSVERLKVHLDALGLDRVVDSIEVRG